MSNHAARQIDELDNGNLLEQARQLFARQDFSASFLLTRQHWLNCPDDLEAVQLLSEIIRKNGNQDLYKHLKILAQSEQELRHNVQSMFEAGYHFIDEREPELAAMLLSRCARLEPRQREIHYELGFALMQLRRFQEAIIEFESLLQDYDDFDTRLNLTVCHSITRNLARARQLAGEMAQYAASQEEMKELALRNWVIKRLEGFAADDELGVRDWFYSLYGSVLLNEKVEKDSAGRPQTTSVSYEDLAGTLVLLSGFLKKMGLAYDVIEYYSRLSRPLASALSACLNLPVEPYRGPDRRDKALLVMAWSSDIIGPHRAFVPHCPGRSLFALGLTTSCRLPVTPEIAGFLSGRCVMPWEAELYELSDGAAALSQGSRGQEDAAARLLDVVDKLRDSSALLEQTDYLHAYYSKKRKLLVLDNETSFPERPEYTAEILH
jgi:tetratricopeptide (TPR) repeat protein